MRKGLKLKGFGENNTINRHINSSNRSNFYPDDDFIKNNQIKLDLTYMLNAVNGRPFISSDDLD